MAYLLDTSIVSDLVRRPDGRAAAMLERTGDEPAAISIITAAELRYGAERRHSARLSAQLELILGYLEVLPLAIPVDREYGKLRAGLEGEGKPIGQHDMLIAAHALALGYVLVTSNEREFARVRGLRIENWLK